MKAVLQTIRILVITLLIKTVRCQDGFSNHDLLRLHQLANHEGPAETITSYNSNIIQRDPLSQSMSSVSVQYHMTDDNDKTEDYNRADRGRNRKVYRIKNPFHRLEDDGRQPDSQPALQDSDSGASNQYAAMQYSLPPEDFLRQMRAENQFYQQQQQPQVSTPAPNLGGYTATPQPPYQYSTMAPSGYDNNSPQVNQIPQLEPKIGQVQDFRSISNSYQYSGPNSYVESMQNTPSPIPPYVSTSNNQYIGTPSSSYVSSSSPIYLSSPANVQFISSSISSVPSGTSDYSNKVTSTIGSNQNYDSQEFNKKMQIDHYDNSVNGIRYPSSFQQYQSEYPSSTPSPSSTPYPDPVRDSWQNQISSALPKSEFPQYQRYSYAFRSQPENRPDQSLDSSNSDTHRVGNMAAANNVYLNFAQPDYQALSNARGRTRDTEQETSTQELYSHGEYGWKLGDRRPPISQSSQGTFASAPSVNFPRYQSPSPPQDGVAVSQMSFHMDTGRPQTSYDHISKSGPDTDAQEFAKAAAKAHENMKQRHQYYANEYSQNYNSNSQSNSASNSPYYGPEKQRPKIYSDANGNSFYYSNSQPDLITASPYYYSHARENSDEKPKLPFDHDKALKNIVPIDVSNVVNEGPHKQTQGLDSSNRFTFNYNKDQMEAYKQNFKTISDHFYQDKNSAYALNIKPRPEETNPSDSFKFDPVSQYLSKPSPDYYNQNSYSDNKRYIDSSSSSANYIPQQSNSFSDSAQSPANVQQPSLQRPQSAAPTDISSILKLNDIPYRLTQNIPPETYRLHSGNYEPVGLPTPLPLRLNQNVDTHQIDVASSILSKLMASNKQPTFTVNRPGEIDPSLLTTVNGFKVANPYNVDLKLVAEMLKGKTGFNENQMMGLREQYGKPTMPIKFDISQLQQLLLKNENPGMDGFGSYGSPFMDIYNNGRFPYTGVKYSRSQEEEETVMPIGESSNNHPIGAVVEQDDPINGREGTVGAELTGQEEDSSPDVKFNEENTKLSFGPGHRPDKHKHPNSISPGRHSFPRKYPKGREPYPLLKPPPPHGSRSRNIHNKNEKPGRRRRPRRPRVVRVVKHEPVYESENEENSDVSFLLRPPPPIADAKSDVAENEPSS
ncbi:hypothetical protein O0L34_g13942 [Tuta absoluta]|nr:hypothetical protein O0L34_g13942 [Tuta absoluta]